MTLALSFTLSAFGENAAGVMLTAPMLSPNESCVIVGTTIGGGGTLAISADNNLGLSGTRVTFDGGALQLLSGLTSNRDMTVNAGGGTLIGTFGGSTAAVTLGGTISGTGGLSIEGRTVKLTATNSYTGVTTVNGTLDIEGSIASSSLTTVNGLLRGAGTLGNTLVASNGLFRPGNTAGTSLTVAGNLAFQSGAQYLVLVNSQGSTSARVSGTASLSGNVQPLFQSSNLLPQYTILTANGGITGTFSSIEPSGFVAATLSYDAHNVFLNLAPFVSPDLNANQHNVAATLAHSSRRRAAFRVCSRRCRRKILHKCPARPRPDRSRPPSTR